MSGPYDDLIGRPHHTSRKRPRMSMENRAAQFSPFAALTGYEDAIQEAARLTDERAVLSESEMAALDMKLCILAEAAGQRPEVAITYFVPDEKKDGGAYVTVQGEIKRIDEVERRIFFADAICIAIDDVYEIKGEMLPELM